MQLFSIYQYSSDHLIFLELRFYECCHFFSRYIWKHGITPRHTDIIPNHILNNKETTLENSDDGDDAASKVNTGGKPADSTNNIGPRDRGLTLAKRGTRLSLTLRKATNEVCSCSYPEHCDDPKRRYFIRSSAFL